MIRYVSAAMALKAFSLNAPSRALYRKIGNKFGARARQEMSDLGVRIERGDLLVKLARKYNGLFPGACVFEAGTGWMHWYGLYLRMFCDIRLRAFDIWDNRQFSALQAGFTKLEAAFKERDTSPEVLKNISIVNKATSFEDLYRALGMEYFIEPSGSISRCTTETYDLVVSMHVLEHVPRQNVRDLIANMYRMLKPGGTTIHQIGIDDHLAHYDHTVSAKQYIKYSDLTWKLLFENQVQYFNRLQTSEWLTAFREAGFELREQVAEHTSIESLRVNKRFANYDTQDLSCTILTLVFSKL